MTRRGTTAAGVLVGGVSRHAHMPYAPEPDTVVIDIAPPSVDLLSARAVLASAAPLTADTITHEQIRELRDEQLDRFRSGEPTDAQDLDYSFAARRGRDVMGAFTGRRITASEGRARCAEILNERAKAVR